MSEAGGRLPGVTTVLGQNLAWNKDVLMKWANREGLAGRDISERRDRAADIGTFIHAFVEADVQGSDYPAVPEDMQKLVDQGLESFRRWQRQTKIEIVATEVWGVDEEYQVGFCIDMIGREEEGLTLLDLKSGSGTYADHFLQVAAYTVLFERLLGEKLVGAHVLRVGKDSGTFHHVFWPRHLLDRGWIAWTWCRALHSVRWEIEKYVR